MLTTIGWVCFGMAVWGLSILMQALQRRFAPELGAVMGMESQPVQERPKHNRRGASAPELRDQEIAELKERIETLEAIVTDRRYQWEQELQSN